jgi:hypothetical protein
MDILASKRGMIRAPSSKADERETPYRSDGLRAVAVYHA